MPSYAKELVAIVALVLVAWKAIGAGSNVGITWKVTEKAQGKVVISKVSTPARRAKKAA